MFTGIKKVTVASDAAFEVHLQLSNLMKDIPISSLSDDNFYEEECEDLRERIKAGSLKRPTFLDLETKAQVLHKDITKHWIEREVVLLQKRIDHANEKGWRKQLFEFLERKQLLQTKKEQDRLFSVMPKVLAEELAPEVKTIDALEENAVEQERQNSCSNAVEQERQNSCSPKSTPNGASDISGAGDTVIPSSRFFVNGDAFIADGNGDTMVPSNRIVASEDASIVDGNDQYADVIQEQRDTSISIGVERSGEMQVVASTEDVVTQQVQVQPTQTEVIELSDDDPDVEDQKYGKQFIDVNPGVAIWHYLDPSGIIQGPFPLTMLKHWSDIGYYFGPSFSVWMVGQSPQEAVFLVDLLRQFFPVQ